MRLLVLSLLAFGRQASAGDAVSLLTTVKDELQADHEKAMLDCAKSETEYDHALIEYAKAIKDKKLSSGVLEAQLVRYEADAKATQSMINKDQASMARAQSEREAMTASRQEQAKATAKLQAEQTEIIGTIRAAINALQGGSAALLQAKPQQALMKAIPAIRSIVDTLALDSMTNKQLDAFIQASQEDDFGEYVSRGSDVVSLLHNLKSKAEEAFSTTKTQEQNEVFQFNAFMQTTGHEIKTLEAAIADNQRNLASMKVSISHDGAEHKVQLEQLSTNQELEQETKINADRDEKNCKKRKEDHEKTIQNIDDALKVLSSDEMTAAGLFIQTWMAKQKQVALVQVGVKSHSKADTDREDQERAAVFLTDMADRLGSPVLAQVGERVKDGPFDGAIRMLEDMTIKLQRSESVLEFCDKQKGVQEEALAAKQQRADRLEAKLLMINADVEQCKQNLADSVKQQHDSLEQKTRLQSLWAENGRGLAAYIRSLQTLANGFSAAIVAVQNAGGISSDVVTQLQAKLAEVQNDIRQNEAISRTDDAAHTNQIQSLDAQIAGAKASEREYKKELDELRGDQTMTTGDYHDMMKQMGLQEGALMKQKNDCDSAKMTDQERQARVEKELAAIEEALAILKAQNNDNAHQNDPWKKQA